MSDYITVPALKATLGITSASFDADVQTSVTGASRALDMLCDRRFDKDSSDQVRYYSPVRWGRLEIDDLSVAPTSVLSADDGTTTFANAWVLNTDYFLEPLNAQVAGPSEVWPFTRLRAAPLGSFTFNTYFPRSVQITGKFGWPQVPAAIVTATTLLAERLYKMQREAPLGVLSFADVAMRIARADANLMILVGPYMRHRAAIA